MKTLMIAASAALALTAVPAVSQAQEFYGTIGYGGIHVEGADVGALQGRLGYKFNPYIGVEGEAGFGIVDDDSNGIEVGLNNEFGGFGVVYLPLAAGRADLFARAGYASASVEAAGTDFDGDGFAYGVGGQYYFTEKDGARLDWTRLDYGDGDADVWSISYTRKF